MASFAVHYIAGEKFLESLSSMIRITDFDKNNFRLGNLIVDYHGNESVFGDNLSDEELLNSRKIRKDKKKEIKLRTHFRDKDNALFCVNLPNLDKFLNKYQELVCSEFSVLGYLFHLYTDKVFFENLYTNVIECLDKDGKKTNILKDNTHIRVKKNNKVYKVDDFWCGIDISIYDDYTNMNSFLLSYYDVTFDKNKLEKYALENFRNPGIEEVDYYKIFDVIDKVSLYISHGRSSNSNNLNVFKRDDVLSIIPMVVDGFWFSYDDYISALISSKLNNRRR